MNKTKHTDNSRPRLDLCLPLYAAKTLAGDGLGLPGDPEDENGRCGDPKLNEDEDDNGNDFLGALALFAPAPKAFVLVF